MGEHTPGPWAWRLHPKQHSVHLENRAFVVMGFERWGMASATPMFRRTNPGDLAFGGVLCKASDFGTPIPGEEHHDWDKLLDHPDARLIAAAPDLLEACKGIETVASEWFEQSPPDPQSGGFDLAMAAIKAARAAIARAEGRA